MKNTIRSFMLLVLALVAFGCCCARKEALKEYGPVESAVRNVAEAMYGQYADQIPVDFNSDSLSALLKATERLHEYEVLKDYSLVMKSLQPYYLLMVFDKGTLVLFDYSCSPEIDGPLYRENVEYFQKHVPCPR